MQADPAASLPRADRVKIAVAVHVSQHDTVSAAPAFGVDGQWEVYEPTRRHGVTTGEKRRRDKEGGFQSRRVFLIGLHTLANLSPVFCQP